MKKSLSLLLFSLAWVHSSGVEAKPKPVLTWEQLHYQDPSVTRMGATDSGAGVHSIRHQQSRILGITYHPSTCRIAPPCANPGVPSVFNTDAVDLPNLNLALLRNFSPVASSALSVGQQIPTVDVNRPLILASDPITCACLQENYSSGNDFGFKMAVDLAKQSGSEVLATEFRKSFLNDYAQYSEDVQYFVQRSASVLGTPPSTSQTSIGQSLSCGDPKMFQAVIDAPTSRCRTSKMPENEKLARMRSLFSAYGEAATGTNLTELFDHLNSSINSVATRALGATPGETAFSVARSDFDLVRKGLTVADPSYKSAEALLTGLIKLPAFKDSLKSDVLGTVPPVYMIQRFIENPANTQSLRTFLKLPGIDPATAKLLSGSDFQAIISRLNDLMTIAENINPAVRLFLSDPQLLRKIVAAPLLQQKKTVFEILDHDPTFVRDSGFTGHCDKIKASFEQAICGDDSQLIDLIEVSSGARIIDNSLLASTIPADVRYFLGCASKANRPLTLSHFGNPIVSSYAQRREDPENDYFSSLSKKIESRDPSVMKFLEITAVIGQKTSVSLSREAVASAISGSQSSTNSSNDHSMWSDVESYKAGKLSFSSTLASAKIETPDLQSPSGRQPASSDVPIATPQVSAAAPPISALAIPQVTPTSAPDSESAPSAQRAALRDSINNPEQKAQFDREAGSMSEAQMAELSRLREDALRDRKFASDLTSQLERDRIAGLQREVEALEKRKRELTTSRDVSGNLPAPVAASVPQDGGASGARSVGSSYSAASPSVAPVASLSAPSSSGPSSDLSNSRAGQNAAAQVGTSGPAAASASAARLQLTVSSAPLTVSSVKTFSTNPQSTDLSQEVISLINSDQLDTNSLAQIKEKGMIYRFRVVQDGVENMRELRISYDSLTPEAKRVLETRLGSDLDRQITEAKRRYSYATLRRIIGTSTNQ